MAATTTPGPELKPHERLRRLVHEEIGLLGQVDALSQRQAALIGLDDSEPLLALVTERQGIIERVAALATEIGVLRERCAEGRGVPVSEWREIEKALAAAADLAERIAARDRGDVAALGAALDGVAVELSQLERGRGAAAAYGDPKAGGGTAPRFQDREG